MLSWHLILFFSVLQHIDKEKLFIFLEKTKPETSRRAGPATGSNVRMRYDIET